MSKTKRRNSESHPQRSTQTFPLAHPPPKSQSRPCLRISSRLLLQIQQLSSPSTSASNTATPRAIPILQLYKPSHFGKSVTNGLPKLHSRDMYLTQSEPYVHLKHKTTNGHGNGTTKPRSGSGTSLSSRRKATLKTRSLPDISGDEKELPKVRKGTAGEEGEGDEDVVAVIYTSPRRRSKSGGGSTPPVEAELHFPPSQTTWEATSPSAGRYRFRFRNDNDELQNPPLMGSGSGSELVFEWEKRPPSRSPPVSGSDTAGDDDRFVLGIVSASATSLKRPWLARLTRKGVHVGGLDACDRETVLQRMIGEGAGLYTWILTMGVWVARQEGWLVNS